MAPIPDATTIPGLMTSLLAVSPTAVAVFVALVAAAAWLARGAAEELRKSAAREWEARIHAARTDDRDRAAA